MKKIFFLGTLFALFTITASAQKGRDAARNHRIERGFETGNLTRAEKYRLHKNDKRFRFEKRRAMRDGRITASEKRRLYKMRAHDRRDTYRYRHNARRRVI